MPYIGGELSSFACGVGGCRTDVNGVAWFLEGGEVGGVIVCDAGGMGPGGQYGMCLLGTGVVDRGVLRVRAGVNGGGVGDCRRGV